MTKKLLTIIVVSFVTINALFLASVSLLSYEKYFEVTSKEISKARLTLVNESMKKVSSFITSVSDAGVYIVTNRGVKETFLHNEISTYEAIVEQRNLTKLMNDVASFKRGIYSIELYTDRYDPFPRVESSHVYSLTELENEPWFGLFKRADSGWTPRHKSLKGEQYFVSYIHRLLNEQGKTIGYIKVNVLADTLFDYISDQKPFYDMDEPLLLLDGGGRVIGEINTEANMEVLRQVIAFKPDGKFDLLKSPFFQLSNEAQLIKQDHKQYLFMISKPSKEQWRLVHLIPVDSLYKEMKKIGLFVLVLAIISLLLSIPIAYIFAKKLFRPIKKIIEGMKEVEKGNFQVRVQPHFIEEYKTLALNFNHMTLKLDESMHEIERKNKAKREAEIRTLQNQIVPHFLYNTLDMIHWRALDYQADDISYMVNQLSKMFRIGLSGGNTFIRLRDELEHAQCYINIQNARLRTSINYVVRVPATLKDVYVPKVILQPFIENSMKHGFPNVTPKEISLRIVAKYEEGEMIIDLIDNGIGVPGNWSMTDSEGVGIKNIQERIKLYYGENYGVKVFNHPQGGTAVRIHLPIMKELREEG
ncbi:sensor histidine kinase [Bacillus sp. FJAT-50079]|uniref:cache domain-containing sensor histidine kinase n=1 Tax=Bacillus sp. FJAT-50079 TaxID=2833577 RepID=UPI001BC9580B|nr:sensor histidine kinase [Bacillus sp. FJAT-50079]MBS4208199.1 sensor histidine kinase [Bacillus sp. FJAT-50079]